MLPDDSRSRVLIVEDEEAIRDLVGFHLDRSGYDCTSVADGRQALDLAVQRAFDVIILDLGLPSLDGMTLCQTIRQEGVNRDVPILMLTARREEGDKVLGLESGADDYLSKPFGVREFLARVNALMRRPRSTWRAAAVPGRRPVVSAHGVTVDPIRRLVTCDGRAVSLTPQEFSLLYVLISNPGIVLTREDLLARVWSSNVYVTGRGVDALVKRLRRKVEANPSQPTRILTERGTGYKFAED
jgi:DNA-binding response OmpR family regulator